MQSVFSFFPSSAQPYRLSFSPSPFTRSLYLIVIRAVLHSRVATYAYTDRRKDRIDVSSANCISIPLCSLKLHLRLLRYAKPRATLGHTSSALFSASPTTAYRSPRRTVSLSSQRNARLAARTRNSVSVISLDRKSRADRILFLPAEFLPFSVSFLSSPCCTPAGYSWSQLPIGSRRAVRCTFVPSTKTSTECISSQKSQRIRGLRPSPFPGVAEFLYHRRAGESQLRHGENRIFSSTRFPLAWPIYSTFSVSSSALQRKRTSFLPFPVPS